jgi:hypothetical protein
MSANCETPFWKDPTVLVKNFNIDILHGCFESKVNAFLRGLLSLLLLNIIVGVFFDNDSIIILTFTIWILYMMVDSKSIIEKFKGVVVEEKKAEADEEEGFADSDLGLDLDHKADIKTFPTASNPFMNVLVDEVKYNPTRASAAPIDCPLIQDKLDNFYRVQWWSDPTDVYGKNQGQRQFYTMPSTSVPSDRQSFQEWLFKIPGKTCKEGNRDACNPGTNGGAIPWLSQPN